MKERDIQNYLYTHPEVLFPNGNITEKTSEYIIQGKRIDLLFVVDGIHYIVEVKNVPIQREHIGQIIEYYGLMRKYLKGEKLSMIFVSSSIQKWRADSLKELGINCVEIPNVPTIYEQKRIQNESKGYIQMAKKESEIEDIIRDDIRMSYEDIACPYNEIGKAFAKRMICDSSGPISKLFSEYEMVFRSIKNNPDFVLEFNSLKNHGEEQFNGGCIWWAYSFGFTQDLPPNDAPNISIIANIAGLDVTVSADTKSARKAMLERIKESTTHFDRLLVEHGDLWLKTYLKFEHFPRRYHRILVDFKSPEEFDGADILRLWGEYEKTFAEDRERWIRNICSMNKELKESQRKRLEKQNKNLNLAIRLVKPINKSDTFWSLQYEQQLSKIIESVHQLKPFVDFFIK